MLVPVVNRPQPPGLVLTAAPLLFLNGGQTPEIPEFTQPGETTFMTGCDSGFSLFSLREQQRHGLYFSLVNAAADGTVIPFFLWDRSIVSVST